MTTSSLGRTVAKWAVRAAVAAVTGLALIVLLFALLARSKHPRLEAWHRLTLHEEFHAGRSDVKSFDDYLRLEDRLFAELHKKLLDDPAAADPFSMSRYHPGSAAARRAWETPYNRSYELKQDDPRGAVLLVHGLSDSPYSVRALAETIHDQGYDVVVLRMPGHGTTPSMLRDVSWKDWYASVVLAARYAASRAGPGKPFVAVGHSTGAALITLYSVRSLDDASLPRPARLYLMSPAIGISKFAFMTSVLSGLSFIPYFESSAWLDVLPEYDPYKYNSFPVNAANQIYHVTHELRAALAAAKESGRIAGMPRLTVFQSLVDATVSSADVVRNLLAIVPGEGNELVVFDVNRREALEGLLTPDAIVSLEKIRNATDVSFRITRIGTRTDDPVAIAAYSRAPGSRDISVEPLPLAWPAGVFSLSHVAVPFPVDDPVYGLTPADDALPPLHLGNIPARGESGALVMPAAALARLRCNPFFDVIRSNVIATCKADEERTKSANGNKP